MLEEILSFIGPFIPLVLGIVFISFHKYYVKFFKMLAEAIWYFINYNPEKEK